MNMTEGLLLYFIKKFNGERSLSGFLHMLNGKKTSQTLSDGHLFNVSSFFGILPGLHRDEAEQTAAELLKGGMICLEKDRYTVTEKGEKKLEDFFDSHSYLYAFDGMRYKPAEQPFYQMLSLYIQSLSHAIRNDYTFFPVSQDPAVLHSVKTRFPKGEERQREADQLYREMFALLCERTDIDAEVFVLRLSRHNRTGLTNKQVAQVLNIPEVEVQLRFRSMLHFFLKKAKEENGDYRVLNKLAAGLDLDKPLTLSAQKTWHLLNEGKSMDQIIHIRRMKKSTIEDHLVEIAIHYERFSIDPYVTMEEQHRILNAYTVLQTKKLKVIKDKLEDISYFKIRLVLGKAGDVLGTANPVI
ncbi:helix-turn-helix domain-containing protein [Fictibacillus fluitans]|uniref:Helix-turn-helix domain-containing protein n=1 Tax=Fictibacillus fluitans TaxID=3058422 RepID=A0ABT8I2T7_9BACL|nr:helix-turn-helix domain-containing protein [Fictibacillus sp. NE201]MDN4527350.1 helix-turn-helix domain-containing protein [Fictibacillus sp. NE201]